MVSKKMFGKEGRFLLIGIPLMMLLVLLLSVMVYAESGQSEQELQGELANLTSELVDGGYSWLINYSLDYPSASVEVYLENGVAPVGVPSSSDEGAPVGVPSSSDEGKVVAVIENTENFLEFSVSPNSFEEFRDISGEGFYRSFLDRSSGAGLGRLVNGSWVGVLDSEGKIPFYIFEKKRRIDELKQILDTTKFISNDNLRLSNVNKILSDENGN